MPLQIRRGTEADRAAQTVAFAAGELVYTTDSQKLYVGDGTTVGGIILSGFNAVNAKTAAAAMFTGGTSSGITYSYDSNAQVMNSTVSFPSTLSSNLGLNGNNITGTGNINITGTVTATSFSGSIGGNLGSDIVLNSHNITGTGSISISGNVTATTFYGNLNGGLAADLAMNSHNISGSGNLSTTGNVSANVISGSFSGTLGSNLTLNSHDITGTGNINNTGNISISGTITATNGLGADLSLNNHNITGTGNINITGSINASSSITGGSVVTSSLQASLGNDLTLNSHNIVGTGNISTNGSLNLNTNTSFGIWTTQSNGAILTLNAFRGTLGSPTVVQTTDIISGLVFKGYNGSSYQPTAGLVAYVDNVVGSNVAGKIDISVINASGAQIDATFNSLGVFTAPVFKPNSYSVAGTPLPTASSVGAGARAFVTDATSTTFGAPYTGSGSNKVPVYSDGTGWYIG